MRLVRFLFLLLLLASASAQPPLTSDPSQARLLPQPNPGVYPGRAALFQEPKPFYVIRFHTNETPLLVRTVISSNVLRGEIWWNAGTCYTNYEIKSSNVISVVTNSVGQ